MIEIPSCIDCLDDILDWLAEHVNDDPWCNDVADILLDMNENDGNAAACVIAGKLPIEAYEKLVELTGAVYRPHYIQCKYP